MPHSPYYLLIVVVFSFLWSTQTPADSLQSGSRALQHSVNAAGYAIAGGAQLVSAAAAVPFGFVGAVGQLSEAVSEGLFDAAAAEISAPLPVSDTVVTAGPSPSEAMRNHGGGQP